MFTKRDNLQVNDVNALYVLSLWDGPDAPCAE